MSWQGLFLVQKALKNFEILKEQIDNDVFPEKPPNLEYWRCDYCEYSEECKKLEKKSA